MTQNLENSLTSIEDETSDFAQTYLEKKKKKKLRHC